MLYSIMPTGGLIGTGIVVRARKCPSTPMSDRVLRPRKTPTGHSSHQTVGTKQQESSGMGGAAIDRKRKRSVKENDQEDASKKSSNKRKVRDDGNDSASERPKTKAAMRLGNILCATAPDEDIGATGENDEKDNGCKVRGEE
nr:uncharacterized protein CTRU02_05476 [Colletotrichum truncatum]KAF6793919.1 hypothetical protein CTRU02_05476 [Colletotrichum truncatum]